LKKPLSQLGPDLRELKKKLNDPEPEPIHRQLLDFQARIQIGHEQRLGPSLKAEHDGAHVFRYDNRGRFEFGTRVSYARFHNSYRRRNGLSSFLDLPDELLRGILAKLTDDAFNQSLLG